MKQGQITAEARPRADSNRAISKALALVTAKDALGWFTSFGFFCLNALITETQADTMALRRAS